MDRQAILETYGKNPDYLECGSIAEKAFHQLRVILADCKLEERGLARANATMKMFEYIDQNTWLLVMYPNFSKLVREKTQEFMRTDDRAYFDIFSKYWVKWHGLFPPNGVLDVAFECQEGMEEDLRCDLEEVCSEFRPHIHIVMDREFKVRGQVIVSVNNEEDLKKLDAVGASIQSNYPPVLPESPTKTDSPNQPSSLTTPSSSIPDTWSGTY